MSAKGCLAAPRDGLRDGCRPPGRRSCPGSHNRLVPVSPHVPSPADLAVRLRDRRHHAPPPARSPWNQAKPAADITDWAALTPDDFFAALKTVCRAESVPRGEVARHSTVGTIRPNGRAGEALLHPWNAAFQPGETRRMICCHQGIR